MLATRNALRVDGWSDEGKIEWFFHRASFKAILVDVTDRPGTLAVEAVESKEAVPEPRLPFDNKGREEKLETPAELGPST
jgi:hypothetical protein